MTSLCLKIIKCQVLQWQQNTLAESQLFARVCVGVGGCVCVFSKTLAQPEARRHVSPPYVILKG